nr:hypothetical protein [Arenimonas sp.]
VLDRLAETLHEIQLVQLVPKYQPTIQRVSVQSFASSLDPQVVQIWYQMAIIGRKDLPLAPSARLGFEMSLLRMLAFLPAQTVISEQAVKPTVVSPQTRATTTEVIQSQHKPVEAVELSQPGVPMPVANLANNDDWIALVQQLNLRGPDREIGLHAAFLSYQENVLKLAYPVDLFDTINDSSIKRLQGILSKVLGDVQLKIERMQEPQNDTLFARESHKRSHLQSAAESEFQNHPVVSGLLQDGAKIVSNSIQPLELK